MLLWYVSVTKSVALIYDIDGN